MRSHRITVGDGRSTEELVAAGVVLVGATAYLVSAAGIV